MAIREVGILLIHGVGRHKVDAFVQPFSDRLAELHIPAKVKGFVWSDLTESQIPTDESKFDGILNLQRAIKNTAHLPITNRLAAIQTHSLPQKISNALLEGFWAIVASTWGLFYVYDPTIDWKWSWLLWIPVLLFLIVFFSSNTNAMLVNLRRSLLLVLWPIVLVIASPIWLGMLGFTTLAFALLSRALTQLFPNPWPQDLTFEGGLPLSGPSTVGHFFAVALPLLILLIPILYLVYLLSRNVDNILIRMFRLVGDCMLYLGLREHRENAQVRLKKEMEKFARDVDCLVIGAHSLGSVLAIDTIRRYGLPTDLKKLVLITGGSPLKRLFATFFPAAYPSPKEMRETVRRLDPRFYWFNVYRPRDPIGTRLSLDAGQDVSTGQKPSILNPLKVHANYWDDKAVIEIAVGFVRKALQDSPDNRSHGDTAPSSLSTQDYEQAFLIPAYIKQVRTSKSVAWVLITVLSFAIWIFSDSISGDNALEHLNTLLTKTYEGYVMVRKEIVPSGQSYYTRPTFWVEYRPTVGDPSVCVPIDLTIDEECMLSTFFAEPLVGGPQPDTRTCSKAKNFDPLRFDVGRFAKARIKAVEGTSGPATVAQCEASPSWKIVRWLYTGIAWFLPAVVLLLLMYPCFSRRAKSTD